MARRAAAVFMAAFVMVGLAIDAPARADEGGSVPTSTVYELLVDDPTQQVFVSGSNGVFIFDFAGKLKSVLPLPDSTGMVIVGQELYVASASGIGVVAIEGDVVERLIPIGHFTRPVDLAFAGHRLWFFALDPTQGDLDVLVGIRPSGRGLTHGFNDLSLGIGKFARSAPGGETLVGFSQWTPGDVSLIDVRGPSPRLVSQTVRGELGLVNDVAVMPSGGGILLPSATDAASVSEVASSDLSGSAVLGTYRAGGVPRLVDATNQEGLVAVASDARSEEDPGGLVAFRVGGSEPFWRGDLPEYERVGAIGWSARGQLFAVGRSEADASLGWTFFSFRPLRPVNGARYGGSSHLPAALAFFVRAHYPVWFWFGLLVVVECMALQLIPIKRSQRDRVINARVERSIKPRLGPDEHVNITVLAHARGSIPVWFTAVALMLVGAIMTGFLAAIVLGVNPVVRLLVPICVGVAARLGLRDLLEPRRLVVTERRLLMFDTQPLWNRPRWLLVERPLGVASFSSPATRDGLETRAIIDVRGYREQLWVPPLWSQRLREISDIVQGASSTLVQSSAAMPGRPDL